MYNIVKECIIQSCMLSHSFSIFLLSFLISYHDRRINIALIYAKTDLPINFGGCSRFAYINTFHIRLRNTRLYVTCSSRAYVERGMGGGEERSVGSFVPDMA